jgi:hypothetical protein
LIRYLFPLATLIAGAADAQAISGNWKDRGDRIEAQAAQISFPRQIAALRLKEAREFSHPGESLDNVAEYRSADGALWASIYIYLPSYGDAALAEQMTDWTIHQVYGPNVTRASEGLAAIGGRADAAIRTSYVRGELRDSGPLASAAAFAHVGRWIVKLRVSGPIARRGEVEAALDAFLAAARVDGKVKSYPVAPLKIAEPCPPPASGSVALFNNGKASVSVVAETMVATGDNLGLNPKSKLPAAFPANGLTPVCLRGDIMIDTAHYQVWQPAGQAAPDIILVQLDDAGDLVTVRKDFMSKGYTIGKAELGHFEIYGQIDRMPDNGELVRVLTGGLPGLLDVRASVTLKANGDSTINIDPSILK